MNGSQMVESAVKSLHQQYNMNCNIKPNEWYANYG